CVCVCVRYSLCCSDFVIIRPSPVSCLSEHVCVSVFVCVCVCVCLCVCVVCPLTFQIWGVSLSVQAASPTLLQCCPTTGPKHVLAGIVSRAHTPGTHTHTHTHTTPHTHTHTSLSRTHTLHTHTHTLSH